MSQIPRSINEINFSPLPGKAYWNIEREWHEEFIYFLMVDRFHDNAKRTSVKISGRSRGFGTQPELEKFYGGTIQGITSHLDYIQGLGCTALWLSPIFENDGAPDRNSGSYHGYAIRNYLAVDPRFGTIDDFKKLVQEAHNRKMRVFLDAVANHCGDVWYYPGDKPYFYSDDSRQYELAGWRSPDYPVPVELRNPDYYHRRGQIRDWGWDSVPETQWGDFFSLKGFNNDDIPAGLELQKIMIDVHRYWMRETDIDGYRMDAVKHMGETAIARFCQGIREYAHILGKRDFFLFGELVGSDDAINRYTGPNTSGKIGARTVYYGLSSVLDFPLYWILPGVIKGCTDPAHLYSRYDALRDRALSRGELGRFLVTFLDNHDQIGQNYKRRFGSGAFDRQIIAGTGYLICALGTPCIYYGTEQGFCGEGNHDALIREALFDKNNPKTDLLNTECNIYKNIACIAAVNRREPALRFGRMYFREISGNGKDFGMPMQQPCTLAFSRILASEEVLVAYNTSAAETRSDRVMVDSEIHKPGDMLTCLYGGLEPARVEKHPDRDNHSVFVHLKLEPMQFAIFK